MTFSTTSGDVLLGWLANDTDVLGHRELAPFYSSLGRPSIDPELMIRMLIVGYVFAIRSEREICRDVQVNLAYRWFCGLGLEDSVPNHSVFSRARSERFRDSDILRTLFEHVVMSCIEAGLVAGRRHRHDDTDGPIDFSRVWINCRV
jgi:transposase